MPALQPLQKSTCQAIVNIFETGRIHGDYGQVTLLKNDTGHLTYGRSQTTLSSGNLYLLIRGYCDRPGTWHGKELAPYLDELQNKDTSLDHDTRFKDILRHAGEDPAMQLEQDAFFDRVYWNPAMVSADYIGVQSALGAAIVYDSKIHGSWHLMRAATQKRLGTQGDPKFTTPQQEQEWFITYVETRRDWLANHANDLLHKTVYRMTSFQEIIQSNKWTLKLPILVRGLNITEEILLQPATPLHTEDQLGTPLLRWIRTAPLQGEAIKQLQQALQDHGIPIDVDGVFGEQTHLAVIAFQTRHHLTADGIVGPVTWAQLQP
ncbi:MAG: chitosanase [Magnetococcales bacterium]|nr:chitosanase [Magnetococcales bacterium]